MMHGQNNIRLPKVVTWKICL